MFFGVTDNGINQVTLRKMNVNLRDPQRCRSQILAPCERASHNGMMDMQSWENLKQPEQDAHKSTNPSLRIRDYGCCDPIP